MTDDELATLAALLAPYRAQVEALWSGDTRPPRTRRGPAPGPVPDLLTTSAAAARLSCSRSHIYTLAARGELVRRDISGKDGSTKLRVTSASVDEYISRDQYRGVESIRHPRLGR